MPISFDRSIVYAKRLLQVLITTQILVGVGLLVVSEYFKRTLLQHLPMSELSIEMHVFCIQFYGVHIIVHYLLGYPLVRRCAEPQSTANVWTLIMWMWHVFVILVSLDGVLVFWMWYRSERGLSSAVERVMLKGVDQYYLDSVWRLRWDEYQVGDQCCGVHGYRDWLTSSTTEWPNNATDESEELDEEKEQYLPMGGIFEQQTTIVPYSCCKKDMSCFATPVSGEIKTWTEVMNISLTSINQNGCLDVFKFNSNVYCKVLGGTVIAVIVLQIFILMLMRFLRVLVGFQPIKKAKQTLNIPSTSDKYSQTKIPSGQPLNQSTDDPTMSDSTFNSHNSVRILYEDEPRATTTLNKSDVTRNHRWSMPGGKDGHGAVATEMEEIIMQKRAGGKYYKVREKPPPRRGRHSQLNRNDHPHRDDAAARRPLLGDVDE